MVNDQPITGEVPLNNDDVLKVGPLTFKVVIEASPAPAKPTPPPQPRTADIMDDDAAAALLFDDDGAVSVGKAETGDEVPGGSTVMDIPAFAGQEGTPTEGS